MQLTATPADGWQLQSWGGACSGNSTSCTVVMTADRNVAVTFTEAGSSQTDIHAWIDSVSASPGDTIESAVYLDLSAVDDGIGAVQGTVRFDPAMVRYLGHSTDFTGTFTPNTDSASAGVIRFGGVNTSASRNRDTTAVLRVKMEVLGQWGSEAVMDLDIPELTLTNFTNVTSRLSVSNGKIKIDPGTFSTAVAGEPSVRRQDSKGVTLQGDLHNLRARIGSIAGRVTFDPAVVRVDSITAGSFGGTLESNTAMQADSGFVRFALVQPSPGSESVVEFAKLWLTAVGQGGDSTDIAMVIEEVSDPVQFADLLPFHTGTTPLRVGVSTGIWGDPNRDRKVTALDALICLSGVVGKDVSQFDLAACDVAPDNGNSFTGRVTALDALAVLSHVVGKELPAHFRVSRPR